MAGRPRKECVLEEDKETENEITGIAEQIEEGFPEEEVQGVLEFTSYGADIFDLIAGGGVPFGKVVNLIGDKSVGKSFISSEIIAQARRKYKKDFLWYYDDAEAGYSFDSREIWGFEIRTEEMVPSETIEEFSLNVDKFLEKLKPGQRGVYVIDSFDGLSSVQEFEEFEAKMDAVEKGKKIAGTMGMAKGKGTNQFFRIMANKIKKKDCILIIVSQVRENINAGPYSPKWKRNGGNSLDMYACQIFWLAVAEKYTKKDTVTGVCVQVKNTKNKAGKPYREVYIDIIFDFGLDNIASNLKYLYDLKTDTGKDSKSSQKSITWDEYEYNFYSLIKHIEDNNLERELTRRVYKKWNDFEASIASSDRKRRHG